MLTPDYCDNHVCNLMVSYEVQEMGYMLMFEKMYTKQSCVIAKATTHCK